MQRHGLQHPTPSSSSGGGRPSGDVEFLERRVERLSLVCRAMWMLLSEASGLSETQLIDRMNALDLLDGRADGKLKNLAHTCARCGRLISPRHDECRFCGADKAVESAFDLV